MDSFCNLFADFLELVLGFHLLPSFYKNDLWLEIIYSPSSPTSTKSPLKFDGI